MLRLGAAGARCVHSRLGLDTWRGADGEVRPSPAGGRAALGLAAGGAVTGWMLGGPGVVGADLPHVALLLCHTSQARISASLKIPFQYYAACSNSRPDYGDHGLKQLNGITMGIKSSPTSEMALYIRKDKDITCASSTPQTMVAS